MGRRTVSANEARSKWRDIVDEVGAGHTNVVVERYGKPVAAVIPYDDFLALEELLEDQRLIREAEAELAEWRRDPTRARPLEEFEHELKEKGLLDA